MLQPKNTRASTSLIPHIPTMDDDSVEALRNNKKSRLSTLKKHLSTDVDESWADLILLVTCFISGLVDSAVFNVWSCFVSMQTGQSQPCHAPHLPIPSHPIPSQRFALLLLCPLFTNYTLPTTTALTISLSTLPKC
jgi:hypothetical protein